VDWTGLSVFVEIAAGKSLAKAAQQLKISPMAATRRLSTLENELGVRLVHRSTRALALTPEGQSLLGHARALLEQHAAAHASVREADSGACGLLRVTTSIAFGRKVAAPLIVDFMRAHPAVKVDLLMSDSLVDLVPEGIDLAVRIANLADSSLVARRLAGNPRRLVASPDYVARHGRPQRLEDLAEHQCLAITGTTQWDFRLGNAVQRCRIDGRFSASSIEGLLQACLGGLGIANLSAWFVQDELADGRLQAVELADAVPEPLGIWAVYPSARLVPARTRLFIAALAEGLRGWDARLGAA
jgi:DNA-binding transcriptional LysR family regulator